MLFSLNLYFSIALISLFNVDYAVPNEFASVTTACLPIVLLTINVRLILILYYFIGY